MKRILILFFILIVETTYKFRTNITVYLLNFSKSGCDIFNEGFDSFKMNTFFIDNGICKVNIASHALGGWGLNC